jgi:asparagine synthase (glutamine-hydrolysing)
MSAIGALVDVDGPDDADALGRMAAALARYGPDSRDAGFVDGAGLIHCGFDPIPGDTAVRQPVTGASGWSLVADVRLDNRDEIAAALGIGRHREITDADLLLASLEAWGLDAVARWIGGFAVIAWNSRHRRLVVARDAIGERPLFIHEGNRFVAVASMPQGLLAHPRVPKGLDDSQIAAQLLLLPRAERTFFAAIRVVEPGSLITIDESGTRRRPIWTAPEPGTLRFASAEAAVEQFRWHLDEAVRCRLPGTGDAGSHLSAGLDSGAITAAAARLLAPSGRRLHAYTSVPREGYVATGYQWRPGDEWQGAAALASCHSNIVHHAVRTPAHSPLSALVSASDRLDQPLFNPCNEGWITSIAREARNDGVRVMLSGAYGNMTISYDGIEMLAALVGEGRLIAWYRDASALVRAGRTTWRRIAFLSFGPWIPRAVLRGLRRWRGQIAEVSDYSAIAPDFVRSIDIDALAASRGWDPVFRPWSDSRAMRLAIIRRSENAGYAMATEAAFGITQRDPAADRRLVEFCLSLDRSCYVAGGIQKRLFKLAMADRMPAATLAETAPKGYQAVDWHENLTRDRDRLAVEIDCIAASPVAARVIDVGALRRLLDDWPADGWHGDRITRDYRFKLLRAVSVGHFIRRAEEHGA